MNGEYAGFKTTLKSEIVLRDSWRFNKQSLTLRPFTHYMGRAFLLKLSIDEQPTQAEDAGRCTFHITHWIMEGYYPRPAYLIKTKLMQDAPRTTLVHGNSRTWHEIGHVDYVSGQPCVPLELTILYETQTRDGLIQLQDLMSLDEFVDFTLTCEDGGSVRVHGAVLACHKYEWITEQDVIDRSIKLVTANVSTLRAFRQYIYTGAVSESDVDGLLKVAKQYTIPELDALCVVVKCRELTAANVFEKLEEARAIGSTDLVDAILRYMKINISNLLQEDSILKTLRCDNSQKYRCQIHYVFKKVKCGSYEMNARSIRPFLEEGGKDFHLFVYSIDDRCVVQLACRRERPGRRSLLEARCSLRFGNKAKTVSTKVVLQSENTNYYRLHEFPCAASGTYTIDIEVEVLNEVVLPDQPHPYVYLYNLRSLKHSFKDFELISKTGDRAEINAVLLASKSNVFRKLINELYKEHKEHRLKIDFNNGVVSDFVNYFYFDNIYVNNLEKLVVLAEQFEIEELKGKCLSSEYDHVTADNALRKLSEARRRGWTTLVDAVLEFLRENCAELLSRPEQLGRPAGPYCRKLS